MEQQIVKSILIGLKRLSKPIPEALRKLSAISVINLIQQLRDRCPTDESIADERIEIFMALHNAMSVNEGWRNYQPDQYKQAFELIQKLFKQNQSLTPEQIDEFMLELDRIGFEIPLVISPPQTEDANHI